MIDILSRKLYILTLISVFTCGGLAAQEICDNLIDDDNDGLIDLLDDDCACALVNGFEYIPNGDFELASGCCTMLSDVNNCLEDWIILQGTPDLYSPDCLSATELQNNEDIFNIDIVNTVINFGVAGSFSETFGVCTNAPLEAGELYIFSSDYSQIDIFMPDEDVISEISVYGFETCSQLENWNYMSNPCNASPSLVELATFSTQPLAVGGWQELNIPFIPSVDIEAIVIMVSCNNPNSNNQGIFLSMDNLSIVTESSYDYQDSIVVNGDVCEFSFFLEVTDSSAFTYQWYFDGEPIIGETGPSIELNGQEPLIQGVYHVTILEDNGCSSSAEYILVIPTIDHEEFYTICPGDSVFVVGKYWDEPGDYTVNYLDTISPCQIKLEFHIDLNDEYEFADDQTICEGDFFDFRGQQLTAPGTYFDSLQTVLGCDSVYSLNLNVLTAEVVIDEVSICLGDSYIFEGTEYDVAGTYEENYDNQFGCDSTLILILTVDDIIIGDTIDITIESDEKYFFNGDSLDVEGFYFDTIASSGGCDSIFGINLIIENGCALDAMVFLSDESCEGEQDGSILVEVVDANDDFIYSIDGGANFSSDNIFDNLVPGDYEILIDDGAGCFLDYGVSTIVGGNALTGIITEGQTIELGESAVIGIVESSFEPVQIIWTPSDFVDCMDCEFITVIPTVTTDYFVTLVDENGCELVLQTTVIVRASTDIYVPNIFTPNNDGINEVFKLFVGTDEDFAIVEMAIHDRWGNKVFEEKITSISNMQGWDGRMNGQLVAAGVYAYYVILDTEGDSKGRVIKGNLTVLK